MGLMSVYMLFWLSASLSKSAFSFAPVTRFASTRIISSTSPPSASTTTTTAIMSDNGDDTDNEKETLSIAILGGGISGLSCASNLLRRHQQSYHSSPSYELEVTLFDTGRLRPGGRCSSRLPGDVPPVIKNRSTVKYPPKNDRNSRRACDNDAGSDNSGSNNSEQALLPDNIRKALDGAFSDSSMDRIITAMGPVDHAAQIISIPSINSPFDDFQAQLVTWLEEGVVEKFPDRSVVDLFDEHERKLKLQPLEGEMYYGKGGMGSIPIAMREYCLSFNGSGNDYTGQSFHILQDVWVSPSNGVKYIGNNDEVDSSQPQWELRAGKKSLGKYHRLVISHNGKCADRIMSRTPAKAFHSLLRTRFAPYVPQWGGKEMTLNSIYSLVFAVKSEKSGSDELVSPIAKALSKLSASNNESVYTVMIKNEPSLRLLSCNTLKHHHQQNPNSDSIIEVYTLLSSAKFGKKFKGPQENLPPDLTQKVTMKMLGSLEHSLDLKEGSLVDSVIDLKLQLWGAAVPMNIWKSSRTSTGKNSGAGGFVYDAVYGVGACGDWILDPSIAGAWESGSRLAKWMLSSQGGGNNGKRSLSVGLPVRSSEEGNGKFVPSLALESGIGTIPSSPNSNSLYEFPANHQPNRTRGNTRSKPTPAKWLK